MYKDGNYQIIPFKNLQDRMVQKDQPESFEDSFFKDVYQQAAELTNIIVKSNEDKKWDDEFGIPKQQTMAIQNVIAFTGRRGTGKTSAMLSFADALADGEYSDEKNENNKGKYPNLKNKIFYAVQYVDSSIVSKNEDFFEILLFRMLQYLNISVENYNRNSYFQYDAYLSDLREKIAKLYNHYTSIRGNAQTDYASSYSLMEKNIEKHNIRREIILLIKEYTRFLSLLRNASQSDKNGYLLICIDDIDMARNEHLDILQCIYQYFMIPGVIVMITLNVPVISATVRKNFYSTMNITSQSEENRILYVAREQTNDFLIKIIPSDMRITMPSWRKIDYRDLSPTLISLSNIGEREEALKIFPNLAGCKWYTKEKGDISPKTLIMLLLADRTKVCLDVAGLKLHFMEPDSLRNLYDLFYMLYHMKSISPINKNERNVAKQSGDNIKQDSIEKAEKEYRENLKYNRRILLNYLYFKMIPEFHFDHTLEMELKGFQAEPMDRRGRRIWDYFYKKFLDNEQRIVMLYNENFFIKEKERYRIENYSFGELFRCLYYASRLDLFDKNFVKAVLASFAFTLPQYIETHKKIHKMNPQERSKFPQLRDVFEYTFIGTWRKDLYSGFVPSYNEKENQNNQIDITIDIDVFSKSMAKNRTETLKHLIYLFLLSTKSVKDDFKVTKAKNEQYIYIDAELDPSAFISGTIRVSRLNDMRFNYNGTKNLTLSDMLTQAKITDCTPKEIKAVIDEIDSAKKDLIWFLLKHTDITYNVIKRTISHFIYYSDANLQVRTVDYRFPYQIFRKFYQLFLKKLEEEVNIYKYSLALSEEIDQIGHDGEIVSPIIKWFVASDDYGKLTIRQQNFLSNTENDRIDDESEDSSPVLFYRYGCGMDWHNIEQHIESSKKPYYSENYLTLFEFLKAEIDKTDYELLKEEIEKIEYIKRNIVEIDEVPLMEIYTSIYDGEIEKIIKAVKRADSHPIKVSQKGTQKTKRAKK